MEEFHPESPIKTLSRSFQFPEIASHLLKFRNYTFNYQTLFAIHVRDDCYLFFNHVKCKSSYYDIPKEHIGIFYGWRRMHVLVLSNITTAV